MATNTTETVRQLQRTLYSKAKQAKEAQFYSLYDKVWREDVLWEAWQQVKANKGAPGVDGLAGFAQKVRSEIRLSSQQGLSGLILAAF